MATAKNGGGRLMREPVPLSEQIGEVARELSFRQVTHQSKIKSGQISRTVSDAQIDRMEYALKTLRFVNNNRAKIEAATGVKIP
jgi:hypothetical protein